jgi:hypothetical protein
MRIGNRTLAMLLDVRNGASSLGLRKSNGDILSVSGPSTSTIVTTAADDLTAQLQ